MRLAAAPCSSGRICCCRPTRHATSAKRARWWSPKPRRGRSMRPDAPRVWDEMTSNMSVETWFGDREATDTAFASADHVVKLDLHIGRVTGVPIELRAAVAHHDRAADKYTLYAGSG